MTGSPGHEEVELKYQLLNPAPQFSEIVEMARSVILAGGTMSPVSSQFCLANNNFLLLDRYRT